MKIGVARVVCYGPAPVLEKEYNSRTETSAAMNVETTKLAMDLRSYILKKWHSRDRGDAIVVVTDRWVQSKGKVNYEVEMTAYGGKEETGWLREMIADYGLDVGRLHQRMGGKKGREVIQMTLDGEEIARFPSCVAAQKVLDFSATNIAFAAKTGAVRYGYKWRYAKEIIEEKEYV